MKNTLIIIGVSITILGGAFFFLTRDSSPDIKNYPSSGANIIAFGDSLVQGVGSTDGNDFVSLLSNQLGVPIENLGRGGDMTSTALTRLDDVLKRDPKIVLVLLGGNDYIRRISKEETFSNLGKMIEAIQNKGSVVILLGVRGGILRDNYEKDYRELSKEYQTAYVPNVLDDVIGKAGLMSDTIHPNNEGYKVIADRIYPVIRDLIN